MTDLLGEMTAWTDTTTTVQPAEGTAVTIPLADIVSGKPVPPRPSAGCTVVVDSVQAVISPSRSVIAGPPDGPVSPRTTRRTTTLCPTQCGPRPGAVGEGTGAPFVWWAGGFIGPTTH